MAQHNKSLEPTVISEPLIDNLPPVKLSPGGSAPALDAFQLHTVGGEEMRLTISVAALLLILSVVVFSQTNMNLEGDILSVDRDWATSATSRGERAKTILNIILTDEYTFTGPSGIILTKSEYLNQISGSTSFRTEDVEMRQYGEALVTGRIHLEYADRVTLRKQYPVNFDYVRYTNVYVKQSGKWRLVSTQFSPVFEQVH